MTKLVAQAIGILETLPHDYQIAWEETFDRRRSSMAQIGGGKLYLKDGTPRNSIFQWTEDKIGRADGLSQAFKDLQAMLESLKSAQGRIDPSSKPAASNWDPDSLREAEARYHEGKRQGTRALRAKNA